MILLEALLELVEQLIAGAFQVLGMLAVLAGRGALAAGRALGGAWTRRRLHRGGPREPLRRRLRPRLRLGPRAVRRLILLAWGPLVGAVMAAGRLGAGRTGAGALAGGAAALVVIVLDTQAVTVRLARHRNRRVIRLYNVARGEWSIPDDQGAPWWVAVKRWEPWPGELLDRSPYASARALRRLDRMAALSAFPALVRFRLPPDYRPGPGAREDFAAHLAEATGLDRAAGLGWRVTWDLPQHAVWAELEPLAIDAPYPLDYPAGERRLIPLALLRRTRELICWDVIADPHGAIAGRTGAGKTVALGVLVIGAGRAGWSVFLVDGKRVGLGLFAARLGVRAVALEPEGPGGWWAVIEAVYSELQRRKQGAAGPPVLLVVDELPMVLAFKRGRGPDVDSWNEPRREAQRKLTEIVSQGRALDVHLWVTGGRLAAVAVEGPMKEHLSALLVLRSSRTGALQAAESTAAASLPKVAGRATWTDARHEQDEAQVLGWAPEVAGAPPLDELLPLEPAGRPRIRLVEPEPGLADALEIVG
jgi:hypothetical protein